MNKVFLSYSSEDIDFVKALYLRLKEDGVDCFFDRESIAWGDNMVVALEKGLAKTELIVLILTPAFFNSDWAELERTASMINKRAKILPLLLKECDEDIIPPFLMPIQFKDISTTEKFVRRYPGICRELGGNPKQETAPEDRAILPPTAKLPNRHYMDHCSLQGGFKGRVKDLWALDDLLRKQSTAMVQGVGVVVGMGGIGKTQLAIEYVHRFGKFYPGGVFWIDVEQGLAGMINRISSRAGLQVNEKQELPDQVSSMWQQLSTLPTGLVVLDNFPEGESLQSWQPSQPSVRLLVTTRRKGFARLSPLNLDVLDETDGIELLNSGTRTFGPEAGELVETLGGLPLALELVRNFLNVREELSIPDLLTLIKQQGEMKSLKFFTKKYQDELPSGHSKEVAATFQLSWDLAGDFARDVMTVIALMAPTAVPRRLLQQIFDQHDNKSLEDPLADALSQLSQKLSLLEKDQDKNPSCHRLISAFVRNRTPQNSSFHDKIITTLLDEMKRSYDVADTSALRELEKVLPHADHLLSQETLSLSPEQQVDLALSIGRYHKNWGRFRQAQSYMQQALDLANNHYPPSDPEIARCCNELAAVLHNLGQYKDAIPYYEQANEIYTQHHGKGHPYVAVTWNNLGLVYKYLGQYDKAIEYYEKALESDLKTYGKKHSKVAIRWNNLGAAYNSLGQYDKAIDYYEKALESDLKTYGKNHPSVARDWNNLGLAYNSLKQYDKAIEYYEKALESDLKTYGKDHPSVARDRNNLGLAYDSLGQYDKTIEYYEQALESDLKTYGKDHPDVAIDWNNLGLAYDSLGEYDKAIEYYEKALESDLKTYGKEHPQVAIYWNNLAGAYDSLGQYDKAIEYYKQALESDLKTYGKDHPSVATRWNNLGETYRSLGQHDKAIEYYELALVVFKKMLGDDHPGVATNWNNLGMVYDSLGQYDKAIEYYEKALESDLKTFGNDHPSVARDQNNLGAVYYEMGKYKEAKGYFEKSLAVLEKTLGDDHPSTKKSQGWLDMTLKKLAEEEN